MDKVHKTITTQEYHKPLTLDLYPTRFMSLFLTMTFWKLRRPIYLCGLRVRDMLMCSALFTNDRYLPGDFPSVQFIST
jgi:hypothetical protein